MHPTFIPLTLLVALAASLPLDSAFTTSADSSEGHFQNAPSTGYLNPASIDDIIGSGVSDPIFALSKKRT